MFSPSKLSSKAPKLSIASKASTSTTTHHSTFTQIRKLSIGTRTLAKMDANNKAGSTAASAQVDPKEVLNNPQMLGAQALHKAYNKYNIKSTEPSADVPRVDHSKAKENHEAGKDGESKA